MSDRDPRDPLGRDVDPDGTEYEPSTPEAYTDDPVDPYATDREGPLDPYRTDGERVDPYPPDRESAIPPPPPAYVPPTTSDPYASGAPATDAKPDVTKRAIAGLIDGAIAGALGLVPLVGWIASVLYVLLRDGFDFEFMDSRSVGKKLMGLRPVRLDGGKMDFGTSARRNWTLCLGSLASFLLVIPVLGWLLYIPVLIAAVVVGIIELVKVFTDPEGRRLGDTFAGTRVVEEAA